jgi:hypothetical protein
MNPREADVSEMMTPVRRWRARGGDALANVTNVEGQRIWASGGQLVAASCGSKNGAEIVSNCIRMGIVESLS